MHFFKICYFVDRKTSVCILFINRAGGNAYKNNTIDKGPMFLIFILQISQKQTHIFDLLSIHNWCFNMFRLNNYFVFDFSWYFVICVKKKLHVYQIWYPKFNVHGQLETFFFFWSDMGTYCMPAFTNFGCSVSCLGVFWVYNWVYFEQSIVKSPDVSKIGWFLMKYHICSIPTQSPYQSHFR